MPEELQTTDTDATASEGDAPSVDPTVAQLNQIAGRDFKDIDDFKKHYENLSSFVGKKDEAGEKLKSILSKAEPYAQKYGLKPDQFLEYYLEHPTATEDDIKTHFTTKTMSEPNQAVNEKVTKLEFLVEHPEAKEHMKLVETFAKGLGVSYEEAYNSPDVKKVINAGRETKGASVINSNSKVASSASDLGKLRDAVIKSGGRTDILAKYLIESGEV